MNELQEILLIKNGELALKGLNRGTFEAVLVKNLKHRLRKLGHFEIRKAQSTVYITPTDNTADMDAAVEAVSRVFGIAAFSRACVIE
jgi:thiamine biosynthesis protein ThiI